MAAANDPADVFIGYSRRDGQTSPALFSTLLSPGSEHASFMKLNTRFYDSRLEAGDDWGEELEKHAGGCKVFVALVGPEWIKVLRERSEYESGVTVTVDQRRVTDWVYKELDLALERETPAAVQIVCINGASFDTGIASELFPVGKVREYFSSPSVQALNYRNDDDNAAFCDSVRKLLQAHHGSPPASSASPHRKHNIFEKIDPWIRFISRDEVWSSLKEEIGVGVPKEATFEHRKHACQSMAMLVAYDNRKDEPRELLRGVSHHLYVKGRYENTHQSTTEEASADEHWYSINSFGWPDEGNTALIFQSILNAMNVESADSAHTFDDAQQSFIPALIKLYTEKRLSPCIYTSIKASDKKNLKTALAFVDLWNQLDWSALPVKLVLVIAVRAADANKFVLENTDSSVKSQSIGLIDSDSIEDWIEHFLQDRLKVDNQKPEPDWWRRVQSSSIDESTAVRFADVKSCFDGDK